MNEGKIFKKFMLRYLLVGVLVVLGCLPFSFIAYKHIRNYIISNSEVKIESGIAELENNIDKMNMISSMISDDQSLILLKKIEGKILADKVLSLKSLSNQMFDLRCIYDFSPMFFVLFHNNDAFVSTNQVSEDFDKYYGKFFEAEGMSSKDFKNILFDRDRKSPFIYVNKLKYYVANREIVAENAILYVEPIEVNENVSTNKAVIAFIIEPKQIAETLLSKEFLQKGMIKITDASEQLIVNYKSDINADTVERQFIKKNGETLKLLNFSNVKKDLHVTVGIPMSKINEQLKDIIQLLFIYASVGILLALVLTVVFSFHWYSPVRQMIKEVKMIQTLDVASKNEFDYVRESLLNLVSVKDELETKILLANTQKQAIELESIFIKGFYRKEDAFEFVSKYQPVKMGYYVAYLQIQCKDGTDTNQSALIMAMELLKKDLLREYIHVRSMTNTEILLIPALDEMENDKLHKIFLKMQEELLKQYNVLCYIGISQKEYDISNINVAYAQARQTVHAYKNLGSSFIEYYQYINDPDKGYFNMTFLNKLYELILCSGRKEIQKMFEDARKECLLHKERYEFHKEEIYHAIGFVYYTANQQLSFIPKQDAKLQKYQQNHSLIQCIDILEASINEVCDRIEENKKSKNIELKDKIIDYVEQNYRRIDLTLDIVSKEVGISDKYLSTFIKEHTGKTFSSYLDELRIGYSKYCLMNTDWSNEKIAEESGFGAVNSFYRVFKKYVGVSPSIYKKNMTELDS